ncbi:MAG: MFS transporter [Candidatus Binatia bacterium]|nr:MFS transporter [Candidatus Binatia bacterium]
MEVEAETRPKARLPLPVPFYYGWLVVALSFITILTTAGTRSALSVMIHPLQAEFGWSRAAISTVASLNLFLFGLTSPLGGWLMDRFGPRRMMLTSLTLLAAGITATAVGMRQLWQLILFWGIITGVGAGLLGPVLGATVANRWFMARRGLALGILNSANSTGQLIFLPLLMAIIVVAGWRGSVLMVVAAALLLMPIIALLMRDDPSDVELEPLGGAGADSQLGQGGRDSGTAQTTSTTSIFDAVKTQTFWLLCGLYFICGATSGGLIGTHLIPHTIDQGFPEVKAAATIGVMGGMNFVGTVISGLLTDRVQARKLLAIFYSLRGVSLFILPHVTTLPGLFVFAVIFGLDWFATVPPTIVITADTFGRRSIGRLYGWIFLSHQVGSACSAMGAGLIYNWYGDYWLAFNIAGVLGLMAGALALKMPARPSETLSGPAPTGTPSR